MTVHDVSRPRHNSVMAVRMHLCIMSLHVSFSATLCQVGTVYVFLHCIPYCMWRSHGVSVYVLACVCFCACFLFVVVVFCLTVCVRVCVCLVSDRDSACVCFRVGLFELGYGIGYFGVWGVPNLAVVSVVLCG